MDIFSKWHRTNLSPAINGTHDYKKILICSISMSLDGEVLVLRILIFSARLKNKWKKLIDFHHITLNFFLRLCVFARSVRCF